MCKIGPQFETALLGVLQILLSIAGVASDLLGDKDAMWAEFTYFGLLGASGLIYLIAVILKRKFLCIINISCLFIGLIFLFIILYHFITEDKGVKIVVPVIFIFINLVIIFATYIYYKQANDNPGD